MWTFTKLEPQGLVKILPPEFGDERGVFAETYNARTFAENGIDIDFVQDNFSLSRAPGTVRGLHFQSPPHGQAKLVRVLRGAILDVAVDLRKGSPTFGHHAAVELDADNRQQLFIPEGFAHGFVTRDADTEVAYKVSAFYAPDHDSGLFWADSGLDINWGIGLQDAILSNKDKALQNFGDFESPF